MTTVHSPASAPKPADSPLQRAGLALVDQIKSYEQHVARLEVYTTRVEAEREEALQEAGRLRARVEELEGVLREATASYPDAILSERTDWLWIAREALGLDGATGDRDVRADGPA